MRYDIIIVGGGAAGLVAAIAAARLGAKVLIIEHNEKLGRKILATGNGKCNFTNLTQLPNSYRSDNTWFPYDVIKQFNVQDTINFFGQLGIYYRNKNGYLYPYSEQASSVVKVLMLECEKLGVEVIYKTHVNKIIAPDFKLITSNGIYMADKIILATGGCASPKLGSDGSGYDLARGLGHRIIKPLPALVQLLSSNPYCKELSGIRAIGEVRVFENDKYILREEGEIQFTNYGVSGIPIMQISRYITKSLDYNNEVIIYINFMHDISKDTLAKLLNERLYYAKDKNIYDMLIGLFNEKLISVLLNAGKINRKKLVSTLSKKDIENLLEQIQNFEMKIIDHNSFENAQVTTGGIDTGEINPRTMESTKVKNLYFAGELIDVDGNCGGYNLQWAWSSGYIAGYSAAKQE